MFRRKISTCVWAALAFFICWQPPCLANETEEPSFAVIEYQITGNTILLQGDIDRSLKPFTGAAVTAGDVEKARTALESVYHQAGYPGVMVNIPEQEVLNGRVVLNVVETRIGRVRVTGNRYFSQKEILAQLPSLAPGSILYAPGVSQELGMLMRNRDISVSPQIVPTRNPEIINIELRVTDSIPLHGSVEVNNRSGHNTPSLRLAGLISYENLWQKQHSISFQYQTAPEEPDAVKVLAGSYLMPAWWGSDQMLALFGVWSDSDTAFGDGYRILGKGFILGLRYVRSLPALESFGHHITIGLDYKDFSETQTAGTSSAAGQQDMKSPVTYLPLSFSYSANLDHGQSGSTLFSGGLNMAFRSLVTQRDEFAFRRYKARGNYLYATAGLEHSRKLPWDMGVFLKAGGQMTDQPLISNEQFTTGGMDGVRGYREAEEMGDDALAATMELIGPCLAGLLGKQDAHTVTPYLFYDIAALRTIKPLPAEDVHKTLSGAGVGIRGILFRNLEFQADFAFPLEDTDRTSKGSSRGVFRVKYVF